MRRGGRAPTSTAARVIRAGYAAPRSAPRSWRAATCSGARPVRAERSHPVDEQQTPAQCAIAEGQRLLVGLRRVPPLQGVPIGELDDDKSSLLRPIPFCRFGKRGPNQVSPAVLL